jgi:DNA polymerase III delta subunit
MSVPMLHLIHGADSFTSAARLRDLRATLDPNGFNGTTLDGQETTFDNLRAACDALPFFGGGRCVDVRGVLTRWKEAARRSAEKDDEKAKSAPDPFAALADYLPKLPPTTTLLLWEPSPFELPAPLKRAVQDLGAAVAVERFDVPFDRALREWVLGRARTIGTAIRPDAVDALLDATCPQGWREAPRRRDAILPDLQRIDTELQKLATAVLGREPATITVREVTALTTGEAETNIFQLVDAAAAGDTRRALALLRAALDDGIVPELVLSLLATRFSLLARVRAVGGARVAEAQASKLGVAPWQASAAARQLTQLGEERVPLCLRIVLDADEAIKTVRAPQSDDALYWAVLELCRLCDAVPLMPGSVG